jgi:crotonobetainyl-CoA:carnitine CoA-transferase CaiB-like acyl-CoA transferase
VPGQAGNNHPTSVPTGVYKTKDGHINIATTGSPTWVRFCKAIEGEHLIEHPDYKTNTLRLKNRDALNADIEKTLASDTSASWIGRLNAAGVAAGPIYRMDEVFADKQVQHIGVATDMDTPDRGTLKVIRQPFTMSRTPSKVAMPTPERGEHTDEVLAEFGFSKDEIAELKKVGAT